MSYELIHGDCRAVMATMPDASIDSIVTDPPYELGFMGKAWDASGIAYNVDLWREALRVLKPGGHLLAFGGTRTYHRMAAAIEDAGFEIRDSIHWLYGSGFPKSLDVSKAIDKAAGAKREPIGIHQAPAGSLGNGVTMNGGASHENVYITAPASNSAKQWDGWGTALKPAHEPIVVARKPLDGTVAANVLAHGTGALNIDGCRVGDEGGSQRGPDDIGDDTQTNAIYGKGLGLANAAPRVNGLGRWPANIVFTHAADCDDLCVPGCPVAELDEQSGDTSGIARVGAPGGSTFGGGEMNAELGTWFGDAGGASRFFTITDWYTELDAPFRYIAKPSRAERNAGLDALPEREWRGNYGDGIQDSRPHTRADYVYESTTRNHHPTVKPVALMRWLVRLVTPPDGTVLDPFAGSGTTLVAAMIEGFHAVGIELTDDYLPIIHGRVNAAQPHRGLPLTRPRTQAEGQLGLFGDDAA